MYKKILAALLAISVAVCCIFSFTACNPESESGNQGGNNTEQGNNDPGKDPGNDPGKDPGNDPGKDPGKDPGNDPGNDPGKDPGKDPDPVIPVEPQYELADDGYYYFSGFSGTGAYDETEITISATYNGVPVKHVGKYTHTNAADLEELDHEEQDALSLFVGRGVTSVIIEEGIESIGTYVFDYNNEQSGSLKSISIPSSVTTIGYAAFRGCTGLTSLTLPHGVEVISDAAFSGCTGLTSISLSDSVKSIGEYAFGECHALANIEVSGENPVYHCSGNCLIETATKTLILGCNDSVIPTDGSVTVIGNTAFYYRSGLTSVTIPESVTEIGEYAFEYCGLTEITIPGSVKDIGEGAFESCADLKSLNICYGVTDIGNSAFAYSGLTSVTIADSVTNIGAEAFAGCGELESITIPDGVKVINFGVFQNCNALTEVTIGNGVTNIDIYAFNGCTGLTDITFKGTKTQWNHVSKTDLWDNDTGNYKIHCTDGDIIK